ncbi:MAG: ATP-dependent 6-phosphofructokinase, partial [Nitrospinota bacterium]
MKPSEVRHLGVLTGGGDCPGLNAVIRAVVRAGRIEHGLRVTGIRDGFAGLIHGRYHALEEGVDELLFRGGTILGSSNRANPFAYSLVIEGERKAVDLSDTVVANFRRKGFDGLVAIGGDGTIAISYELMRKGLPLVAVPKTIDNDLNCTDVTFGFDTAVGTATEAIDRIRTTAESHHRAMVVEVMGRNAGWIALLSGLAGGAHVILIPEIPFRVERVAEKVAERQRAGKAFIILVVAEGARELGGEQVVKRRVDDPSEPRRLGGIGNVVGEKLEQMTGIETRVTVLGHIQRGGTPSTFDRNL